MLANKPVRWVRKSPSNAQTPNGPPSKRGTPGTLVAGKYRIRSVLGRGGMGTVYEAEHVALGRTVAIKILHPDQTKDSCAVKRFHQEARAAGSIGHPNLCGAFDFGELPDGSSYIVMERLRGETLAERIKRDGALSFRDAVDFALQILAGLAAAHEVGVLHRDIKTDNVFLAEDGAGGTVVKLLDFGVSKFVASDDWKESSAITKTGVVMGTPCYFAPEQARGMRDLDQRVDVYATGVLLYEALTGRRPFEANNYNALLLSIVHGSPPPPRSLRASIPTTLEQIIGVAMAKARQDRYANAGEMTRALEAVRDQLVYGTDENLSTMSLEIPIYVTGANEAAPPTVRELP